MDAESRGGIEARMQWVEEEMAAVLAARPAGVALYGMQRYHLGWVSTGFEPLPPEEARRFGGKKLRGVLCLLATEAVGGPPRVAVPAAAAVEFIHNFSLIHDDLEDEDPERRHRPTVWRLWGVPQAVNAGSNMQALVNEAALRLTQRGVSAERTLRVVHKLTQAMLAMTEGQALDLSGQDRWDVGVDDYLRMAAGKTAALTEAAVWCGAAVGATDEGVLDAFARFGHAFGMAFQARDDYLGIWGRSEQTGKPVGADIQQGKRSLPIVHALQQVAAGGVAAHAERELCQALKRREVGRVLAALDASGSQAFTEQTAVRYTTEALACLDAVAGRCSGAGKGIQVLRRIAADALGRDE